MKATTPPLIAHVIHHLVIGGMENGVVNLINRIPPNRYRHCIICAEDFSDFRDRITQRDVEVVAMHKSRLTRLQLYSAFLSELRRRRPTIVHSRNLSGLDALFPARAAGVPIRIQSEHGWDVADLHGSRARPRLLRWMHRPLVTRYVAVSRNLQEYLVGRVGVAPSRITQIYNGVDTALFAPAEAKPAQVMPPAFYDANCIVVGTVGRLQPVKDQLTLVRAISNLVRTRPQLRSVIRLAIVGDGPLLGDIENAVCEGGIADITWLPGARSDMPTVYRCLDVFVLPSLNEGISNTLLEAMASGLPIVTTAVGGNVELVEESRGGTYFAPRDIDALTLALDSLAHDRELRLNHGQENRRRALREFSLDAMVGSYMKLYDTLCDARR